MNQPLRSLSTVGEIGFLLSSLLLGPLAPGAWCAEAPASAVSLDGDWFFAIDPLRRGEEHGWNAPPAGWTGDKPVVLEGWDRVTVPHDYLSDPRYEWTGAAWYRRSIPVPELKEGESLLLRFGRVASECEVWVNGKKAGAHGGGYSAFTVDATRQAKPGLLNHIAIKVDNSWEIGDIPGPRMGPDPTQQMYVWRNYGGLLRSATMSVVPAVFVTNQKVVTAQAPSGAVDVTTTVFLRNGAAHDAAASVKVAVRDAAARGAGEPVASAVPVEVVVPAGGSATAVLTATLPKGAVRLWSVDSPSLYTCTATVDGSSETPSHAHNADFGVRTVKVADARLLLNGTPVRLAGANRVEGHPRWGGLEPAELIDLDLGMMKRAHLDFQRLQHYPPSEAMLDWADRHGMLIIAEAPCWGLTPAELSDARYRDNFRLQLTEMIEGAWNHPCVIGWSVGNEYHGWTPEGAAWTKDFAALSRRLDPTRPTTYAALGPDVSQPVKNKESRGMHWVDFISVNLYTSGKGAAETVDKIHKLWPEKPILISEYGQRVDQSPEDARVRHFRDTLAVVRSRDYVMGLSYWSFNDYRSRYPGGDPTGHRPWGVVTADREPRPLYRAMQTELAPAVLTVTKRSPPVVRVAARSDFPRAALEGYTCEVIGPQGELLDTIALPNIAPGESHEVECGDPSAATVRVVRPTGFLCAELSISGNE